MEQEKSSTVNIALVVIITAILVGGGAYYLQKQNVDEVAGYTTLTHGGEGYSISYPSGFRPIGNNIMNYDEINHQFNSGNPIKIQVLKQSLAPDTKSFDEIFAFQTIVSNPFDGPIKVAKLGDFVTISQYTKDGPGGSFMTYFAPRENSNIYYNILVFEPGYSKNKTLIEKIVSTFKITTLANAIKTPKVQFKYQENLNTEYVRFSGSPQINFSIMTPFKCDTAEVGGIGGVERIVERSFGNNTYCITESSEGAAGTMYTSYTYKFIAQDKGIEKLVFLRFNLAFPNCDNFDDPSRSACKAEQAAFDIDDMVHRMATSITFTN